MKRTKKRLHKWRCNSCFRIVEPQFMFSGSRTLLSMSFVRLGSGNGQSGSSMSSTSEAQSSGIVMWRSNKGMYAMQTFVCCSHALLLAGMLHFMTYQPGCVRIYNKVHAPMGAWLLSVISCWWALSMCQLPRYVRGRATMHTLNSA